MSLPHATLRRFANNFKTVSGLVHAINVSKGWWEKENDDGRLLCLVHSEVSEALEALRKDNPPSEKCPEFSSVEEELADVVIRIMDMSEARGWDVGGAIASKIGYNSAREYKHGGKKF